MAGDWIKMRPALLTSPKVKAVSAALASNTETLKALCISSDALRYDVTSRVMRPVTVASLLVIWGAANDHTEDGVFRNADVTYIDDLAGIPGFGAAMESVGWAVFDEEKKTVTLPNFNEYNTCGKDRSPKAKSSAQRQKEYRERKKQAESVTDENVTQRNESYVTRYHREEKRREEVNTPITPKGVKSAIEFKTFLTNCKAANEKPISDYRPVLDYAETIGLPVEMIELCWNEFYRRHAPGGVSESKRYKDWRQAFRKCVEGNWFKLWWHNPESNSFELTTSGRTAEKVAA
jgi:hypothetical protein